MGARHGDVFFRAESEGGEFLGGKFADDFGRRANDERPGWDFGALGDESAGADEAFLPDLGSIEHHRAHADETQISNRAGVDNRRVADRAARADHGRLVIGEVNHRPVLHIRPLPDPDRVDIRTQDGAVENTRIAPKANIADQGRIRGDKGRERGLGLAAEEFVEAGVDGHYRGGIF